MVLLPVITVLFLTYYFAVARNSSLNAPSRRFENWILGLSIFLIANAIGEKQAMVMFGPFLIPALYLCARDLDWVKVSRLRVWILHGLFAGGAVLCAYYAWRLKKKYGVSLGAILAGATAVYFLITVAFIRLASSDKKLILFKQFLYVWALTAAFIIFGYTDLTYKFYRFIGFGNYMKPIGNVISHSTDGHGSCIEGSFVTCDWRYFFGVTAIKTPLLTLMFGLWGAVALLFSKRSPLIKALLLLPLCFFFGAAMFNKIRIGLRHILPVYPFFFLLAGFAASMVGKIPSLPIRRVFIAAVTLLVILSSARTLSHAPDYLSYFNEWIGGPEQGAKIVGDSNIDWGQDNQRLAEFVKLNAIPAIKIRSTTMNEPIFKYNGINWSRFDANDLVDPAPGYYAVGIGQYAAFQKDPSSWFYKKAPDFRVGKTFYVYKVGNEAHA
ncbi:MAG: hypothetical protein BWY42_01546 [Candidatus Omnitrophica bacterium ADurb.Bin277]|nr:MAG: hypothetical protein BWY42_01546 [Candidatus Omnitrophica bacterium ADurb.Bin277]